MTEVQTDATPGGRLAGRVALVTGSASGIGRAVTRRFIAAGAAVVAVDVNAEGLEELAAEPGCDDQLLPVVADVTSLRAMRDAVSRGLEQFGHLDTVAAIAGATRGGTVLELSDEDRDFVLAVNFVGVWNTAKAALPALLVAPRPGRMAFCGSVGATLGMEGQAAYIAAKHAVVGLAKSLALEVARNGITVNVVSPASIDTGILATRYPPEVTQGLIDTTPVGRLGTPEDVAGVFEFLAGDEVGYMTGENLVIDGGAKVVNCHSLASTPAWEVREVPPALAYDGGATSRRSEDA